MLERCEPCGVTYTPRPLVQEDEPQPATVPYHEAAHPALVQLWRDERARYDAWVCRAVWRASDAWLSLPMDDDP
jgi:hypothetical protein